MPLPSLGGLGGKLNFRPTSSNNFGATQGITSINQPKGGMVSASQLGKAAPVTSAAQLNQTSHMYSSGDKTSMYKPGEAYGSKSSVSVNQIMTAPKPAGTPGSSTPPSRPILPPL